MVPAKHASVLGLESMRPKAQCAAFWHPAIKAPAALVTLLAPSPAPGRRNRGRRRPLAGRRPGLGLALSWRSRGPGNEGFVVVARIDRACRSESCKVLQIMRFSANSLGCHEPARVKGGLIQLQQALDEVGVVLQVAVELGLACSFALPRTTLPGVDRFASTSLSVAIPRRSGLYCVGRPRRSYFVCRSGAKRIMNQAGMPAGLPQGSLSPATISRK
jgi:hypothetical protein